MKILPFFIQSILNFVFPKNPKILVLEALSAEEIHKSLPAANGPEKSDVIALFNYSHPLVKEIVWEVKYGGNAILSARLGEILYDTIIQELEERNLLSESSRTILMPMPISGKRRFERGWNQAELLARAVRDHLADCLVTLPTLLEREAIGSLHFYLANLSGLRRALFPALPQAYETWLGSGDTARLTSVVKAAETHWLDAARQLTTTYHLDPAQGNAQLNALASGDLAGLRL